MKKKFFYIHSHLREEPFCGIFSSDRRKSRNSSNYFYNFCFFVDENSFISFEFFVDILRDKVFGFNISKIAKTDLKLGRVIKNNSFLGADLLSKHYSFLIDFAYRKYGFNNEEKTYSNLNSVIYYLFYLYCLNSLGIDCRNFSINPYAKEKNCVFFKEVYNRI